MKARLLDLVFEQGSLERLARLERSWLVMLGRRRLPEGYTAILRLDLDLESRVEHLPSRVVGRNNHAEEGLAEVDITKCVSANMGDAISRSLWPEPVRENAHGRARRGVNLKPDVERPLGAGKSSRASSERVKDGLEALSTCERDIVGRNQLRRPSSRQRPP